MKQLAKWRLVIKYSVYAHSGLFTCDEAKIFQAYNVTSQTAVSYFVASFIAAMTSYAISLTSFCQEGSESSAIASQGAHTSSVSVYVRNMKKCMGEY